MAETRTDDIAAYKGSRYIQMTQIHAKETDTYKWHRYIQMIQVHIKEAGQTEDASTDK